MQSRNPYAKIIKKPQFKIRIVKSKKGKGSYKRKDRTQRSFLYCLTIESLYPRKFKQSSRSVTRGW